MWAHNVTLLNPFNKEFAVKYVLCSICCPMCAIGALRTDARKKYNIEVNANLHAKYKIVQCIILLLLHLELIKS